MAEDKNGFILYKDLIHTVKKMPIEKAGELFLHILKYVNDENPETDDLLIEVAFEPIKQSLKRDLRKYEKKVVKTSEAGTLGNIKRWHPDLFKKVENNTLTIIEAKKIADARKCDKTVANIADSDSVSDSDSDSDKEIRKEYITPSAKQKTFKDLTEDEFKNSLVQFVDEFGKKTVRSFFEYWSEKNPKGKMKFQLNTTWDSKRRLTTWKNNEPKFGNEPIKPKANTPAGVWNV